MTMDYKPCHIITNSTVLQRALRFYTVQIVTASDDYTEEEGRHYHYLVHWPYHAEKKQKLKPTKTTLVRGARRLLTPRCEWCYNRNHNKRCERCGVWFKLIWCKGDDHAINCHNYIRRKIDLHPEWEIQ